MPDDSASYRPDRREFLVGLASTATLLGLGAREVLSAAGRTPTPAPAPAPTFDYRYRTVSIRHVPELQAWLKRLDRERRLSTNKTYREYIGGFQYQRTKEIANARALVVVALPQNLLAVTFRVDGKPRDVLIPPGYASQPVTSAMIQDRVRRDVLGGRGGPLLRAKLPLKTLAVRTGLAQYGRNNVTFVDGYGSFHELRAYYTDQALPDHWGPLRLMRLCKGCSICIKACPTRCFSDRNFVIDVGKCITLYNELEEPLPAWIPASAHHTLVGCLRCQYTCPANREGLQRIEKLAELTEAETRLLVGGKRDPKLEKSITAKLARFPLSIPHLARSARLALANGPRLA